ncbi:MAG: 3-keto-disaccharide hydrolase, partial [Planctomycetota bacterium]
MGNNIRYSMIVLALSIGCVSVSAESANPYIGHWALTIPGGGAGWLGVEQENDILKASILWGGGSVVPVSRARIKGDVLILERDHKRRRDGKVYEYTETIITEVSGDELTLTQIMPRRDSKGENRSEFTGKRTPPLPPKPDLSKVMYGKPIKLFNGENLDGWKLTNPRQTNGWSVEDGVLVNNPKQTEGEPHISYGNLRTEAEFEDFNLKLEVNVDRRNNSGIYLRGIYEVQVSDAYGKSLDSHNMGGIYSRITPIVSAEKPAGQWQSLDMTLLDRHVTVKLNGKKIIDNEPLLGCTGGALWSDQFKAGPIYLQGDHTGVS